MSMVFDTVNHALLKNRHSAMALAKTFMIGYRKFVIP